MSLVRREEAGTGAVSVTQRWHRKDSAAELELRQSRARGSSDTGCLSAKGLQALERVDVLVKEPGRSRFLLGLDGERGREKRGNWRAARGGRAFLQGEKGKTWGGVPSNGRVFYPGSHGLQVREGATKSKRHAYPANESVRWTVDS